MPAPESRPALDLESLQTAITKDPDLFRTRINKAHDQIIRDVHERWLTTREGDEPTSHLRRYDVFLLKRSMHGPLLRALEDYSREAVIKQYLDTRTLDGGAIDLDKLSKASVPVTSIKSWESYTINPLKSCASKDLEWTLHGQQREFRFTLESHQKDNRSQQDSDAEESTQVFHMPCFPFEPGSIVQDSLAGNEKEYTWSEAFQSSVMQKLGAAVRPSLEKAEDGDGSGRMRDLISQYDADKLAEDMSRDVILKGEIEGLLSPVMERRRSSKRTGQGTMSDLSIVPRFFETPEGALDFSLSWANEDNGAGYFFPAASERQIAWKFRDYIKWSRKPEHRPT
ncbi:uncharacterized protein I303_106057 [Kwoniella dejecticola CBS 10117]|uniref:Uncharacterized protein n=1 Tax=Kwoniella dejecticola CBS 10117 TaxID=1296121 RepID=A0A1A6A156_9TREE|nr:uncharacterized protein I303_06077 [Kwoniella dejecticola CBS 10117]OBR83794.1 hypothetical protein I303_06077 [Kwoniella dejecticola CBS 10117]